MKQIMTIVLVGLLAFTGCKKETINTNVEHYSLNDFTDTRAAEAGVVYKNEIGPSNLKAIVRKVANSDNKYRLILKVDSVYAEAGKSAEGVPQFKMIALESFENVSVTAGLSITDPLNPDKESVLFTKENMQFTKQNENGFFVYASAPFGGPSGTTDEVMNSFDYELVNISYSITGRWTFDDGSGQDASTSLLINESHICFILPGGKTIEQNPEVEKIKSKINPNGELVNLDITISGDPAQQIETLKFVPEPFLKDPKDPNSIVQLPSILLSKTHFSQNSGIAKFKINDRIVWTTSHDVRGKLYGNGNGGGGWIFESALIYL